MDGVEGLRGITGDYFKDLSKRGKESKAYSAHQLAGLQLAEILCDAAHKSLYIRLAKSHADHHALMILAKDIAGKPSVQNKGAYFMRMVHGERKEARKTDGKKNTPHQQ